MVQKRSLRTFAFQQWFRLSRPMTLGVRGLVEDASGRVLLIRHTYTPGWHFPGGGVEKAEPVETALARELVEEAGISITARPALFGVYSNHDLFPNDHVLLFRVRSFEQVAATSTGEIAARDWFAPDALPDGVTPGTRARIGEVFGGDPPARYWTPDGEAGVTIS
jgi:8-oxo-dGTP pyrophosphatase MutT (NUDIX family)